MKKKYLVTIILGITMVLSLFSIIAETEENDRFAVISIPCAEGEKLFVEDYQSYSHLLARYADDKTPIPLSAYYDGYMYATVPKENVDRKIETYISEEEDFSDDNEDYEYHIMKMLSARGIIKGDEEGRALPFDNVTRAEATAMVMRLLGVDSDAAPNSGFKDVSSDDWYAGVITAAKNYGIVYGDSEDTFSPNRNVTREEITVMIARAMWCAGLQKEKTSVSSEDIGKAIYIEDAEQISDWALSAYETVDNCNVTSMVYTDEIDEDGAYIDFRYAEPQRYAARFEVAEIISRVCDYFQIYPSKRAIAYGFDKKMPVIDGSTSTYPFTDAVYGNLFFNGYRHIDKPKSHSKSHASYERLINGEVDMLFASVYPSEDIKELAASKGVELELIPIAYDAMIFFTNSDNPAENLTKEQISNIYVNDAYDNWNEIGGPDALLYPYCRNNDSGSHAQMERHFLNGNEINEKIRNETTSVSMANVLTDVMGSETENPKGYGLGYSIYYYFNNMDLFYETKTRLKLLSIDGVYPSDETIADGTYPLSNNTYIVMRKDESENSPARKMAEFMLTESGQECVKAAGYGPLKKD